MDHTEVITISHEAAEGTLITGDFRPHQQLVKTEGFRWSGKCRFWYLPNSRDRQPQTGRIARTAEALRGAGFTVEVSIDTERRTTAEVEADRAERLENRQEGLAAKADKLAVEAERRFKTADDMASVIPFGQPILVGHYSEGRDRRYRDRIGANMDKGVAAYRESEEVARRATASERNQAHRETAPATIRRIEKLQAEIRGHERALAGKPCVFSGRNLKEQPEGDWTCRYCGRPGLVVVECMIPVHYEQHNGHDVGAPPTGDRLARITEELARLAEEVAYWTAHLATLEAAGVKLWGPGDFKKGDYVKYWGGWSEVVRVNKKSLSVKTGYSWTDTLPYDKVNGRRDGAEVGAC